MYYSKQYFLKMGDFEVERIISQHQEEPLF